MLPAPQRPGPAQAGIYPVTTGGYSPETGAS